MGDFMFKSFEDLLITIALISNSFGVDILNQFSEDRFLNSPGGYVKDSRAALELYRALQSSYPDESLLEKHKNMDKLFTETGIIQRFPLRR
jgi:ent-kaurene synthase